MADMLVRLYDLPDHSGLVAELRRTGVEIRPALAAEKHIVMDWVRREFGPGWASECDKAMANTPVSCLLAIEDGRIVGFVCHEAACRDFLGPMGVTPAARGRGIGRALLWSALRAMAASGYAYAVVGDAGPADFYAKAVGAEPIPNSKPGFYRGMLKT